MASTIDNKITFKVAVHDFDKEVLAPLKEEQEAARVAEEAKRLAEQQAAAQAITDEPPQPIVTAREVQQPQYADGLTGSFGYARAGGNCVREAGINNPGWGNPINWPVTSYQPWIGATALFGFNHTAVVTGIWSNGDIEVRHQNYWGGQHRFPRGSFRGFR